MGQKAAKMIPKPKSAKMKPAKAKPVTAAANGIRGDGRYQKALALVVSHYCGKKSSFCKTARLLQANYKVALAKNDIAAFKRKLDADVKRSCAGKGSSTDRCKALQMLQRAAEKTHSSGAKPAPHANGIRGDGRYQKALALVVSHYCGKKSSFCSTAKGLQADYKRALAKNDIAAFKRKLDADVKRSC